MLRVVVYYSFSISKNFANNIYVCYEISKAVLYFSQRYTPTFWWDYEMTDIPLPIFREVIKNQFLKNQAIKDIRIIDRKVYEANEVLIILSQSFYYMRRLL